MRACALGQFRMTDETKLANYPGSFSEGENPPVFQGPAASPNPTELTATEQVIAFVPDDKEEDSRCEPLC